MERMRCVFLRVLILKSLAIPHNTLEILVKWNILRKTLSLDLVLWHLFGFEIENRWKRKSHASTSWLRKTKSLRDIDGNAIELYQCRPPFPIICFHFILLA